MHSPEIPDELIHAFATLPAGMARAEADGKMQCNGYRHRRGGDRRAAGSVRRVDFSLTILRISIRCEQQQGANETFCQASQLCYRPAVSRAYIARPETSFIYGETRQNFTAHSFAERLCWVVGRSTRRNAMSRKLVAGALALGVSMLPVAAIAGGWGGGGGSGGSSDGDWALRDEIKNPRLIQPGSPYGYDATMRAAPRPGPSRQPIRRAGTTPRPTR